MNWYNETYYDDDNGYVTSCARSAESSNFHISRTHGITIDTGHSKTELRHVEATKYVLQLLERGCRVGVGVGWVWVGVGVCGWVGVGGWVWVGGWVGGWV
jgi:hypothetical protein